MTKNTDIVETAFKGKKYENNEGIHDSLTTRNKLLTTTTTYKTDAIQSVDQKPNIIKITQNQMTTDNLKLTTITHSFHTSTKDSPSENESSNIVTKGNNDKKRTNEGHLSLSTEIVTEIQIAPQETIDIQPEIMQTSSLSNTGDETIIRRSETTYQPVDARENTNNESSTAPDLISNSYTNTYEDYATEKTTLENINMETLQSTEQSKISSTTFVDSTSNFVAVTAGEKIETDNQEIVQRETSNLQIENNVSFTPIETTLESTNTEPIITTSIKIETIENKRVLTGAYTLKSTHPLLPKWLKLRQTRGI